VKRRPTEFFIDAIRVSLSPRFSGVIVRCWLRLNRFSRFSALGRTTFHRKTAEAVRVTPLRTGTPLKRGYVFSDRSAAFTPLHRSTDQAPREIPTPQPPRTVKRRERRAPIATVALNTYKFFKF